MQYTSAILFAAFAVTNVLAHGVPTEIQGANGVNMPALSVIDGTPRDCPSPNCGAEADTSIIRDNELGTQKASAIGRTEGGGPVDAAKMVSLFMDASGANSTSVKKAREIHLAAMAKRGLLDALGGGDSNSDAGSSSSGTPTPDGASETGVEAATGQGATSGLPTCSDSGVVSMTYHQVNQDGAGPLSAAVDPTSGGTDTSAFKSAEVTQDVPGIGIGGLSTAQTTDFPVQVQMPAGMTCSGSVGGAENVCVAMVRNNAAAGPFGGSVAFTQSKAARKRAIEYNLSKRRFARKLAAEQLA